MERLLIPEKIKVGYQNRDGTYTGKLAYVIYYDEKGKLRKEKSWSGWRHDSIPPDDFKNEPTEGFVLNKGVGGARESWGWNTRNEYIRVFDPRGFEFEISVANLLFILQECTSIKGKGLEGKFVYSWDGTDLVLLPVDCFEYEQSMKFTANKSKKITKDQMIPGRTYLDKQGETLLYLGRETCRRNDSLDWGDKFEEYGQHLLDSPTKKFHVFRTLNEYPGYKFETGFTKLAEIVDENTHVDFLSFYDAFMQSSHVCNIVGGELEQVTPSRDRGSHNFRGVFKCKGEWYVGGLNTSHRHRDNQSTVVLTADERYCKKINEPTMVCDDVDQLPQWADGLDRERYRGGYGGYGRNYTIFELEEDEIGQIEFYIVKFKLSSGELIKSRNHYVY